MRLREGASSISKIGYCCRRQVPRVDTRFADEKKLLLLGGFLVVHRPKVLFAHISGSIV